MSQENILKTIKKNKPVFRNLPEIGFEIFRTGINLKEEFIKNFEVAGGKVVMSETNYKLISSIKNLFEDANNIISLSDDVEIGTINPAEILSAKKLDKLDLAIVKGEFGVAENGAVWISDRNLGCRLIPFIASHLILILEEKEIIENMHDAYDRLSSFSDGYGVFISGPSKTADIEQSLVIGAQGALSTTVFIVS